MSRRLSASAVASRATRSRAHSGAHIAILAQLLRTHPLGCWGFSPALKPVQSFDQAGLLQVWSPLCGHRPQGAAHWSCCWSDRRACQRQHFGSQHGDVCTTRTHDTVLADAVLGHRLPMKAGAHANLGTLCPVPSSPSMHPRGAAHTSAAALPTHPHPHALQLPTSVPVRSRPRPGIALMRLPCICA